MAVNLTMRAVLWTGIVNNVTVANVPIPTLQAPGDAIVKVTAAGICGTDLHTYHGTFGPATPPWILGHEAVGIVSEVAEGVQAVKIGDKVVVPDNIALGSLNLEQPSPEIEMGGFLGTSPELQGCQAEYVRIPNADYSLIHISPNATSDLDYLFLSDVFATAWQGLDFSGFEAGNTVAVFGAGPIGLVTAYSAKLRGSSTVYVIDHVSERLDIAKSIGAVPINFMEEDPVDAILAKEPNGVIRSVDCVGYEAINKSGYMDSGIITQQMVAVTASFGGMGTVGVYVPAIEGPGSPLGGEIEGDMTFPLSTFVGKNLQWRSGAVDPKVLAPQLLALINSGKASPSFVISSKISIEEAPEYYSRFSQQVDSKVVIQFN